MRRRLIPVLAASILFAGTGFSAAAGKDDLSGLPCDRSVATHPAGQPKIPRDYPVEQRIGQYRLFIPWAYLLGRPDPWRLNCPQRFDWTSIAFWIPDLQAPERDLSGKPFRPPVESNRPAPGPDEWVLRINRLGPIRDADTSIPEMVRNTRQYRWKGAREIPEGTLTRVGRDWFHIGKSEDVFIECYPTNNCRMFLDLKDYQFRILAQYAGNGVGQFDLVLTGLRKLLVDWQAGK
ncbi:MAG: hypothetical protein WBG88_17635 [Mesorhizobium sp.]